MDLVLLVFLFVFSTLSACTERLLEGSPCWTDGKNGTCVNLYKCTSASTSYLYFNVGVTKKIPPLPPVCTYRPDGEPVVCCTDCTLDYTEKNKGIAVMPDGRFYNKSGSKAWTKCYEYFQKLPYACRGQSIYNFYKYWVEDKKCDEMQFAYNVIYFGDGGTPASRNQFPHAALLGYGPDQESAQWLCGGTVISNWYILTAAHCTSTPLLGPITYAALGILKRSDLIDRWKIYKITSIIRYPEYKPPSKYHDIALIKTQTEINFGKSVLPACLDASGGYQLQWGSALGWGRLGRKGDLADNLQAMHLEMYTDTECSSLFPPHRHFKNGYDNRTQMCFGRRDIVVDTCEGDSGGPLHTHFSECVFLVFGVTSYGRNCGIPGNAGMYTRVSYYLPWIESIVWPDE